MDELQVAKLDSDDIKLLKEMDVKEEEIRVAVAEFHAQQIALWEHWRRKYKLDFGGGHYIKEGKVICRQVI